MPSRPAAARPTPSVRPPRTAAVPTQADLDQAKTDALLQLKIGRTAHLYSVGASAALALDGILLLLFFTHLPTLGANATGFDAIGPTFYLLIPILAGVGLSAIALALKWGEFDLWPWEAHFATTVGALALNVLILVLYSARVAGEGFVAHLALYPTFFPLALAGITLALLGLVLTWTTWDRRHTAATAAAVLPLATALLIYFPPTNAAGGTDALAVALFLSAFLYQTAGSFLHLISSGTQPHEHAVIQTGQTRIFQIADEVRKKEEALRFRETAVMRREADADAAGASIQREQGFLVQMRSQVEEFDQKTSAHADEVAQRERALVGRIAEVEALARQLESRTKAVELKEQEATRQIPQITAREQRLAQREGEQAKRGAELQQREKELARRAEGATQAEARLEARRKELDQKTTELLRREGEVSSRESGRPGAPAAGDLVARESRLKQLKVTLDQQNEALGRKAKDLNERTKAAEEMLARATAQEASLASREAALSQREAEVTERLQAADERRTSYEGAARDYQALLGELGRLQVDTAQKGADLTRSLGTVSEREKTLAERERRLTASLAELDRREHDLLSRERTLESSEAELGLRRVAAEEGRAPPIGVSDLAGAAPGRTGPRGGRAPPGKGEPATPAPQETTTPDLLAPPTGRRYADRRTTGTPRLDDLLLGGLPPRAHIVLLGDAFVGKEVVLYSFLAEGLKRGESVILVSASRSPAEVSQSLGIVLPQFLEYEQKGKVTWIDASGSGAAPNASHIVVKGSDDRAGILSSLVQASKAIEERKGGPYRVGFLGLSAVLAHGDERASFSFLQNVVGILKPRDALAVYALEGGALSEAQVESLLGRMDGAIVFRQDRDRTFLAVKGFGDVQTREWIECRATNRALIVGSFALERIR
jgi:KaiC/GvpD/RAD55 family RecA-like ATPase